MPLWPRPPSDVRLPSVACGLLMIPGCVPTEPMFGRTLPTVALESEPGLERLSEEPRFMLGERRPLMPGEIPGETRPAPPRPRLEGARTLPMLGETRMPPRLHGARKL